MIVKILNDYIAFRTNPANDTVTDGMWCGESFPIEELISWKMAHPAEMLSILEKRRALYADELIKIDQSLLAKARSGDARAIELVWARYENWTTKTEEQAAKQGLGKSKTLADLMGEL